jgi:hypothetical protein
MFTETRRLIQKAEEDNSVINIHPLDMTELINELPDSPAPYLGTETGHIFAGDSNE